MKKYKVLQSEPARQDIVNIAFYINVYLNNPAAAKRFVASIDKEIRELENFPYRYQAVNGNIRIKPVASYSIAYLIDEENKELLILRVLKDDQDMEWALKRF